MIQTLPLMAGLVGSVGLSGSAGGQSVRPGAVGARAAADLVGGVAQRTCVVMSPKAGHRTQSFRELCLRSCFFVDAAVLLLLPVKDVLLGLALGLANRVLIRFRYGTGQISSC